MTSGFRCVIVCVWRYLYMCVYNVCKRRTALLQLCNQVSSLLVLAVVLVNTGGTGRLKLSHHLCFMRFVGTVRKSGWSTSPAMSSYPLHLNQNSSSVDSLVSSSSFSFSHGCLDSGDRDRILFRIEGWNRDECKSSLRLFTESDQRDRPEILDNRVVISDIKTSIWVRIFWFNSPPSSHAFMAH